MSPSGQRASCSPAWKGRAASQKQQHPFPPLVGVKPIASVKRAPSCSSNHHKNSNVLLESDTQAHRWSISQEPAAELTAQSEVRTLGSFWALWKKGCGWQRPPLGHEDRDTGHQIWTPAHLGLSMQMETHSPNAQVQSLPNRLSCSGGWTLVSGAGHLFSQHCCESACVYHILVIFYKSSNPYFCDTRLLLVRYQHKTQARKHSATEPFFSEISGGANSCNDQICLFKIQIFFLHVEHSL